MKSFGLDSRFKIGRRGTSASPRVLLFASGPYLAFIIHLDLPEADITEVGPDADLDELFTQDWDLVFVPLNDPRLLSIRARKRSCKLVGVPDHAGVSEAPGFEAVLGFPLMPVNVRAVLRRTLGIQDVATDRGPDAHERVLRGLNWARVSSVAAAGIFEFAPSGDSSVSNILFASLATYVAARIAFRRSSAAVAVGDVVVAAAALALGGGVDSGYLLFAVVCAIQAGLLLSLKGGMIAGVILCTPVISSVAIEGQAALNGQVGELFIFPIAAILGGLLSGSLETSRSEISLVEEANRTLSILHHLTRAIPGGLDVASVSQAVLDEVKERIGSPKAALVLNESGEPRVVGSFGLDWDQRVSIKRLENRLSAELNGHVVVVNPSLDPGDMSDLFVESTCWLVAPLRHRTKRVGMLLAACSNHSSHDADRVLLQSIADDCAIAIDNAQLFERVSELSLNDQREQLAKDLHSGLAQSLTRVRIELELMARRGVPSEVDWTDKMNHLIHSMDEAVGDVRSTVLELKSAIGTSGLGEWLRNHLNDLEVAGGPEARFESHGAIRLKKERQSEIFRVAQQAIMNAVKHPETSNLTVRLDADRDLVKLAIEDDAASPIAFDDSKQAFKTLQAQTTEIGGDITMFQRAGSGTTLVLSVPQERE